MNRRWMKLEVVESHSIGGGVGGAKGADDGLGGR